MSASFGNRYFLALGVSFLILASSLMTGKTVAQDKSPELQIAVVGPTTGDLAFYGEEMERGARLAAEDINARGGLNGEKIAIHFMSDKGDAKSGGAIARKLLKGGVRFVVGHYNSTSSIFAAPIYSKGGALMISPSSTNPKFTDDANWNTFRTSGRDDVQGAFAADYIAKNFAGKNIAILYDGTPYGEGLALAARKTFSQKGIKEKLYSKFKSGPKSLATLVKKLNETGIDVVFAAALGGDIGKLLKEARGKGFKGQFVTGDGAAVGGLEKFAGEAAAGLLMAFSLDDNQNPNARETVKKLRNGGFEPIAYTLKSYAAVQVIVKGIEMAGTTDAKAVAGKLRSGPAVQTVLGSLSFDAKGDRNEPDVMMYEWKSAASGRAYFLPKY